MPDDLFSDAADALDRRPLAARMRPRTLDEVVGQSRATAPGSPLRRLVDPQDDTRTAPASVVLWGPPGSGKTTLASLVAQVPGRRLVELSAVSAGVKEVRAALDAARLALGAHGQETVLFVDEVHRFSRTQQDALLPAVENRWITLIAATTENPGFSVVTPLLSRSLVVQLEALGEDDLALLLDRALGDPRGLGGAMRLDDEARAGLLRLCSGDARRLLTALEASAGAALADGRSEVTRDDVETAVDAALVDHDRAGDAHYDVASALIKSIRGSDPDAAIHYLARMLHAGEDPRFIARRLVIAAAEDIGPADPRALLTAQAAAEAVASIGMPEGRIVLAHAVLVLATAPKSNSAYRAIDAALEDIRGGRLGPVPLHLRNAPTAVDRAAGHGREYVYPHDLPERVAAQQYLPDVLVGRRYYEPGPTGEEVEIAERLRRVRAILDRATSPEAASSDPDHR